MATAPAVNENQRIRTFPARFIVDFSVSYRNEHAYIVPRQCDNITNMKAVLFDVDGTLLDTTEFILQAYEYTLKESQVHVPEIREKMKVLFGQTLMKCYETLVPGGDPAVLCDIHDTWQSSNLHLVKAFPTVVETVDLLRERGIRVGAVTNRMTTSSRTILAYSNLTEKMETIIGFEDVVHPKPHPEGVLKAISLLGVAPEETVMVGDSEFDILAGKAARAVTVGIRTGLHPEAMEQAEPDYVIDRMEELLAIVR